MKATILLRSSRTFIAAVRYTLQYKALTFWGGFGVRCSVVCRFLLSGYDVKWIGVFLYVFLVIVWV